MWKGLKGKHDLHIAGVWVGILDKNSQWQVVNDDQSEGARRNLAVAGKEVCLFGFFCSCNILDVVKGIEEMITDIG